VRRLFTILIIAAVAAALLVTGLYVGVFAPGSSLSLSRDTEQWARFGEYLGGTLGAAYGFLAFIGILVTIAIQRRQSQLDEIQRLLATVAKTIDELFREEPRHQDLDVRTRIAAGEATPMTVFYILAAVGTLATEHAPEDRDANCQERIRRGTDNIRQDCALIVIELQQLVQLLGTYLQAGGSPEIVKFYKDRYRMDVAWLQSVGLLASEIVERYFSAAAFVEYLIGVARQRRLPLPVAP
jgi:hypothetical protein